MLFIRGNALIIHLAVNRVILIVMLLIVLQFFQELIDAFLSEAFLLKVDRTRFLLPIDEVLLCV